VDQEAVSQNISKTMSAMRGVGGRRGRGAYVDREAREEVEAQRVAAVEREKKLVRVNEFITVSELAQTLKIPATQIVAFAFKNLGLMVTINQRLDFDQIELIAGEFGFQAVREAEFQVETSVQEADRPEDLGARPPVVTIMGHVDHGKTSLLDYIRKANVVAGESGGITQHIGAYHVSLPDDRKITFLDTPGHEAFTAMRARGAQVTDIVVLVVAADDQVMPQTVEAISHARNAGVPLIVAINKVDLPTADPNKVKQDLLQHNVVVEDFGGDVLSQEISAKKGTGVAELLEKVLLQADLLELKANADRRASGAVVEAQLDPGKGPVATILIQNGTLRVGDDFICGVHSGRVRALLDERGKPVKSAGPAIPVQVLGLTGVPMAGDQLVVVEDAAEARDIAQRRERLEREARSRRTTKGAVTLEDFMSQAAAGQTRQLKILIKADQGGPAEALADALQQLSTSEVQVEVVQRAVGAISESDILLAKAAGAIIIGFHVRPDNKARTAAEREGVDIKLYRIIYEAVADVRAALEGLLRPEEREVIVAEVEVRETFKVPRIGVVAGCFVRSGTANRQARVRVVRDGVEVYEGTVGSLRRFKEDVREVREGFECGIGIENFNDIKVGDVLEFYRTEEVARTLESSPAQS
jgi:translation initiation factor IF-2